MGKKRVAVLGDVFEEEISRKQKQVKREQKAIREGKTIAAENQTQLNKTELDSSKNQPKDNSLQAESTSDQLTESFAELERIKAKTQALESKIATGTHEVSSTPAKKKRIRSSRYLHAKKQIKEGKIYPVNEAIEIIKKTNLTKFNASVELHINVIKKDVFSNQIVELPHGAGNSKKVAVVNPTTIEQLENGRIEFDVLLAAPQDMPKLVKFAKLLGPRGLMPNPKNGTIVENPE